MRVHIVAIAIAIAIVSVLMITAVGMHLAPGEDFERKAAALDEFCKYTKYGVEADLAAFESGKASLQIEAGARVLRDQAHHGDSSLRVCLGDRMLKIDPWCRINEDFKCLADQARAYLTALERR